MSARLNSRHVKPMYYPNFFTPKRVTSLKWETLVGEKGAPVIADVVSFDSSAPEKTREVISKCPVIFQNSRKAWHERKRLSGI